MATHAIITDRPGQRYTINHPSGQESISFDAAALLVNHIDPDNHAAAFTAPGLITTRDQARADLERQGRPADDASIDEWLAVIAEQNRAMTLRLSQDDCYYLGELLRLGLAAAYADHLGAADDRADRWLTTLQDVAEFIGGALNTIDGDHRPELDLTIGQHFAMVRQIMERYAVAPAEAVRLADEWNNERLSYDRDDPAWPNAYPVAEALAEGFNPAFLELAADEMLVERGALPFVEDAAYLRMESAEQRVYRLAQIATRAGRLMSKSELAAAGGIAVSNVSRVVRSLVDRGLVEVERRGKAHYVRAIPQPEPQR